MMSTCPAWRVALEGALDHGRHSPQTRYVQVATVRPDSCPSNRTLVFRAFLDPGHQLVFTTDLRTAKVTYLETNPWTDACWYFVLSREQFRIAGRAMVCAQDGETEKACARGERCPTIRVRLLRGPHPVGHARCCMNLHARPETNHRRN